jgi:integrase
MARIKARRTNGAGSIRKLPSGRLQARFRGPDGGMVSAPQTFEARVDAEAWLSAQRRDLSDGIWREPSKAANPVKGVTLDAYFTQWLADKDDIRPSTRELYEGTWRRTISPTIGTVTLGRLTADRVRDWRADLSPDNPTQTNHAYALLRQVLTTAVDRELLAKNPAPARKKASVQTHEAVILNAAEIRALADAMPDDYRAMVFVAAWCGLRLGEVIGLQRRDIDIAKGCIYVNRGAVRTSKGKTLSNPKSAAGVRTVIVPSSILGEVDRHLNKYTAATATAFVFPGQGGEILATSTFYRVFYKARETVGQPALHWHDLRHTAGTLAAQAGGTVKEVQDRLGHSTANAAMRYQHTAANRQQDLADRLAKMAD